MQQNTRMVEIKFESAGRISRGNIIMFFYLFTAHILSLERITGENYAHLTTRACPTKYIPFMPIKYAKFLLNIWQSVELIIFVFPFLFLIIKSKMLAHRISSRDAAIFPNSKCISRHRASGGQASCCSYTNWPQHAQGCLIVYIAWGEGGGG
jgi:hypothetical protein